MRPTLLLLAAACGSGLSTAPVLVTLVNLGPANQLGVSLHAQVKADPQCVSNCDMHNALPDGGADWWGLPFGFIDAGASIGGAPQEVELGATMEIALQRAGGLPSGFAAVCSTAAGNYSSSGNHITATLVVDGGYARCDFTYGPAQP